MGADLGPSVQPELRLICDALTYQDIEKFVENRRGDFDDGQSTLKAELETVKGRVELEISKKYGRRVTSPFAGVEKYIDYTCTITFPEQEGRTVELTPQESKFLAKHIIELGRLYVEEVLKPRVAEELANFPDRDSINFPEQARLWSIKVTDNKIVFALPRPGPNLEIELSLEHKSVLGLFTREDCRLRITARGGFESYTESVGGSVVNDCVNFLLQYHPKLEEYRNPKVVPFRS